MRTSPQLSSSFTLAHKWITPACFLLGWPLWVWSALRGPLGDWIGGIFWIFWLAYWLIWSWSIERVPMQSQSLSICNYFTNRRVSVTHLDSVTESYGVYSKMTHHLDRSTPFGKPVRIIPPQGLFISDRKSFDELASYLPSVVNDR